MEWTQPIRGGLGQVCFRPTVIFSSMTAVQTEQYKDMEWRYSAHILILLVRSMNFRSKITTWFVGWCQHSPMTVWLLFFFFFFITILQRIHDKFLHIKWSEADQSFLIMTYMNVKFYQWKGHRNNISYHSQSHSPSLHHICIFLPRQSPLQPM